RGLDGLGALVLLLSLAGEDLDVDYRAFDSRRAGQRSIANVAGLFAEDRAQQLLFRSELGLALGRNLAHHDVALLHRGADADHAALIQVTQRGFADVGDVARNFFGPQLGVAGLNLEFLDMD